MKNIKTFFVLGALACAYAEADTVKALECNTQGSSKNYVRLCLVEVRYDVGHTGDSVAVALPGNVSNNVGCVLNDDGSVSKCIQPPSTCGESEVQKENLLVTIVRVLNKKIVLSEVVPLKSYQIVGVEPVAQSSSPEEGVQPLSPPIEKPYNTVYEGQFFPNITTLSTISLDVATEVNSKGKQKAYLSQNGKLLSRTPFYFSRKNLVDKVTWCEGVSSPE